MVDSLAGVGLAAAVASMGVAATTLGALATIIWNQNEIYVWCRIYRRIFFKEGRTYEGKEEMKKNLGYVIVIISLVFIIVINHFCEQYKTFSIILFMLMILGAKFVKET